MSDTAQLQDLVASIVADVFAKRLPKLQEEVAQRVAAELANTGVASNLGMENPAAALNATVNAIQGGTSQADILGELLEGCAQFASRAALFVVRGNSAVGWRGRNLPDGDFLKQFSLDPTQGLTGRAVHDRTPAAAAAAEFSSEFVRQAGNPADGNCIVLPLLVREKVPAFVYADRGTSANGKLDTSALELLVRTAGLWLEAIAARRSGAPAPATEHLAEAAIAPPEKIVERAAAAEVPPPAAPVVLPPERVAESVATLTAAAPVPVAGAAPPTAASTSGDSDEVHKKAKRFAKLLVDEIKLYNKAKVQEGRQKGDLYDRLKDDIDKSRATYDKRYGGTAAATADYFTSELVRILADNDASLLGSNFRK